MYKRQVQRQELQVFNLNKQLIGYKQRWKEHLVKHMIPEDVYKRQPCDTPSVRAAVLNTKLIQKQRVKDKHAQ